MVDLLLGTTMDGMTFRQLRGQTLPLKNTTRSDRLMLLTPEADLLQTQGILPEQEWEPFMDSLKSDLPTTFRVTESRA